MNKLHFHNKDVCSQIRNGYIITSISQCVHELVLNSIDAKATNISIFLDTFSMTLEVTDNGCGLTKNDLENTGTKYMSSKCNNINDSQCDLMHYGFRGETLSSISELSNKFKISTCCKSQMLSKTIHNYGKYIEPIYVDNTLKNSGHGTTISVQGLFSNRPVRYKNIMPSVEIEQIKTLLNYVALVHCWISFHFQDKQSGLKYVIVKNDNLLSRARQILNVNFTEHVMKQTSNLVIEIYCSKQYMHDRSVQLVYVNKRLVHQNKVHSLMKQLFKEQSCNGSLVGTTFQSTIIHPVYVVLISCPPSWFDIVLEPAKTVVEFNDWQLIMSTIQALLTENNVLNIDKYTTADSNQQKSVTNSTETTSSHNQHQDIDAAVDLVCVMGQRAIASHHFQHSISVENQVVETQDQNEVRKSQKAMFSASSLKPPDNVTSYQATTSNKTPPGWVKKYDPKIGNVFVNLSTGWVTAIRPCTEKIEAIAMDKDAELVHNSSNKSIISPSVCQASLMHFYTSKSPSSSHSSTNKLFASQNRICFLSHQSKENVSKSHSVFIPDPNMKLQEFTNQIRYKASKLSKNLLKNLQVIGQISDKFIACLATENSSRKRLILIFDQHAVHERIRLEKFTNDALTEDSKHRQVKSTDLQHKIRLKLSDDEHRAMIAHRHVFLNAGLQYEFEGASSNYVVISKIPAVIASSKDKVMIIRDLIHERTEKLQLSGIVGITLPPILHEVLCSRACHGAIRFGDSLSWEQCADLMKKLSDCKLPFQCAHGRPSVCPLINLSNIETLNKCKLKFAALKQRVKFCS